MWRRASPPLLRASFLAASTTAAVVLACDATAPRCETTTLRKRTTLGQASQQQQQLTLEHLRRLETNIVRRWERDEEDSSWRDLPARAWPPVQPEPSHLPRLQALQHAACRAAVVEKKQIQQRSAVEGGEGGTEKEDEVVADPGVVVEAKNDCQTYTFQIATTLLFYGVDPDRGFQLFQRLADTEGHVDSMVACGCVLVEGLGGIPIDEPQGIAYLERAAAQGSSQAYYELGTIYYVGLEGVVEENEETAFALFEQAAAAAGGDPHPAAMYMMADCLATGVGTPQDIPRAVPLFYQAAERGHRFARQRIRELLASSTAADPPAPAAVSSVEDPSSTAHSK